METDKIKYFKDYELVKREAEIKKSKDKVMITRSIEMEMEIRRKESWPSLVEDTFYNLPLRREKKLHLYIMNKLKRDEIAYII